MLRFVPLTIEGYILLIMERNFKIIKLELPHVTCHVVYEIIAINSIMQQDYAESKKK